MSVKRRTLLAALGAAGVSTLTTGDDEMSKFGPAAFSQGDIMRRMRRLESEVAQLRTARNLQSAAIGGGGLRIHSGGGIRVQGTEEGDQDVFRVSSDPAELHLREDLLAPHAVAVLANRTYSTPESATVVDSFGDDEDVPPFAYAGAYVLGQPAPSSDLVLENVGIITGTALVTVSAQTRLALDAGEFQAAHVSFEVTGATNQEARDSRGAKLQWGFSLHDHGLFLTATTSKTTFITGLNPGLHNFRIMYRNEQRDQPVPSFAFRNLTVVAF